MPSTVPDTLSSSASRMRSTIDTLLVRLTRLLQSVSSSDKLLSTLYYTLLFLRPQLTRLRHFITHKDTLTTIRRSGFIPQKPSDSAIALLPSETVLTILEQQTNGSVGSRVKSLEGSVSALTETIGDYRLFTRLWGLLAIYAWAKETYARPAKDDVVRRLVWGQIAASTLFQVLENVAYLASKGVVKGRFAYPRAQAQLWAWSCRFWTAHLALEAARLLRTWQITHGDALNISTPSKEAEQSHDGHAKRHQDELSTWRKAWYVNAAFLPVALHYSVQSGVVSDEKLGFFGLVASVVGLRQLWQQTV